MKALIWDTETTGLVKPLLPPEKQPEIIEYFGAMYEFVLKKKPKRSKPLHILFKPKGKISEEITRITGIKPEDVAHAKGFEVEGPKAFKHLESAPLVIGHNVKFDRDMIEIEAARLGYKMKWPRLMCTIEQTMHLKGYRLNLNALHTELIGQPFEGAHRAEVDVEAVARCVDALFQKGLIK